jgi:L-iditol 2-dehydrogenase
MKALVLEDVGKLVYKDVPTPAPQVGEVLLHIKACGICSSDFDRCLKTGTYHFPTIPGHEFAGQVVAVGDGVDSALIGRRAAVFPLLPCRKCDQCRIEAYARCRNYNYFGSRCDGAFAEYIAVPEWNLQLFDDALDYSVAALCEPAAVAYHSVAAADVCPGMGVCIIGTGTIGILAGMWARERGCGVTFVSRNERKNEFLRRLGFNSFLASGENDADVFPIVLECVGSDMSLAEAVQRVSTAGQIVLVGNPNGDKNLSRKRYWKILREEVTVKGVWNSSYTSSNNEWHKVLLELTAKQGLFSGLITSKFPLSGGIAVFDAIRGSEKLEIKGMFVNE